MTYYELLEISEKASPEVIRMAYKALCKKYHPDIYQGDKKFAEEKMKQLNEAYEVLSDATKKRQYDASLSSQRPHQQSSYQPRQESYSPPRQKPPRQQNSSFSITMLLASGFVALKDGNWALADSFFNEVISFDPTRADAYLGKLMVELRVRTKEGLKNCKEPFNYKLYYQKAFSLADDSLKQFLKETIQHINNRNYEQKCSSTYHYACSLMHLANKIKDFENAIAEFEKIRKYKDSAKKIDECYKKIAEINSAILAAKAEKEKRAKERKEKLIASLPLFKKIAIIVVPVLIVAILAATILPRINWATGKDTGSSTNTTASSEANSSDNSSHTVIEDVTSDAESAEESSEISSSEPSSESAPSQTPDKETKPAQGQTSNNTTSTTTTDFTKYIKYEIKNGEAIITSFDSSVQGKVVIPSELGGCPVTSIEDSAFLNCGNITGITIPKSVTNIGAGALAHCFWLTSIKVESGNPAYSSDANGVLFNKDKTILIQVPARKKGSYTIPNSVTYIGESALMFCQVLTSVTIPNSVTDIGRYAFFNCSSLTSITIPNSVLHIDPSAFFYCYNLTNIKVESGNPAYSSDANGVLFNKDKTILIRFPTGKNGSYTVPNSVTHIGDYSLSTCHGLTSVIISNSVTSIGEMAFDFCNNLTSVTIGNGVTSIGNYAFTNCQKLTSITIPDSVIWIGGSTFSGCFNLTKVYVQNEEQKEMFKDFFEPNTQLIVK